MRHTENKYGAYHCPVAYRNHDLPVEGGNACPELAKQGIKNQLNICAGWWEVRQRAASPSRVPMGLKTLSRQWAAGRFPGPGWSRPLALARRRPPPALQLRRPHPGLADPGLKVSRTTMNAPTTSVTATASKKGTREDHSRVLQTPKFHAHPSEREAEGTFRRLERVAKRSPLREAPCTRSLKCKVCAARRAARRTRMRLAPGLLQHEPIPKAMKKAHAGDSRQANQETLAYLLCGQLLIALGVKLPDVHIDVTLEEVS